MFLNILSLFKHITAIGTFSETPYAIIIYVLSLCNRKLAKSNAKTINKAKSSTKPK